MSVIKKRTKKGTIAKIKVDEDLLGKLARIHCTYEEMGHIVGCSRETIKRRYDHIVLEQRSHGNLSLRRAQFRCALKGNPAMLIYLGKVLLKQRPDEDSVGEVINVIINDRQIHSISKTQTKEKHETIQI